MKLLAFNLTCGGPAQAARRLAALAVAAGWPCGQARAHPFCYAPAAAAGSDVIQALRSGILVLIVPPLIIIAAIAVAAIRGNRRFAASSEVEAGGPAAPPAGDDAAQTFAAAGKANSSRAGTP